MQSSDCVQDRIDGLYLRLIEQGACDLSDYAIASSLSRALAEDKLYIGPSSQGFAPSWFNLFAVRAFRMGHTAIPLEAIPLQLLLEELFRDGERSYFHESEKEHIIRSIHLEIACRAWELWNEKIQPIDDGGGERKILPLPFSLDVEESLSRHIARLAFVVPSSADTTDEKCVREERSESFLAFLDAVLNHEQKAATIQAMSRPFTIISGGPGTGKTHTAGVIIALLAKRYKDRCSHDHSSSRKGPYRVLVTAPTGKAVYTLHSSIRKAIVRHESMLGLHEESVSIEAKTIHKCIFDQRKRGEELTYHAIIIDECSMIDSLMMTDLFEAIATGARVILLGDSNQLPPIQAGQPFRDLLSVAPEIPEIAFQRLTHCVRTESRDILSLAQCVIEGDTSFCDSFCPSVRDREVAMLSLEEQEGIEALKRLIREEIILQWKDASSLSLHEAQERSISKKILSATRRGSSLSTQQLNYAISEELRSTRDSYSRSIEPVLITKNMYHLDCMNGDSAILESQWNPSIGRFEDTLHFVWKESGSFPAILCPHRELGYAMTVHKSQGSEFSQVYFIAGQRGASLTRELLYTAITRAKKKIVLIGKRAMFQAAVLKSVCRYSALPQMIRKACIEMRDKVEKR